LQAPRQRHSGERTTIYHCRFSCQFFGNLEPAPRCTTHDQLTKERSRCRINPVFEALLKKRGVYGVCLCTAEGRSISMVRNSRSLPKYKSDRALFQMAALRSVSLYSSESPRRHSPQPFRPVTFQQLIPLDLRGKPVGKRSRRTALHRALSARTHPECVAVRDAVLPMGTYYPCDNGSAEIDCKSTIHNTRTNPRRCQSVTSAEDMEDLEQPRELTVSERGSNAVQELYHACMPRPLMTGSFVRAAPGWDCARYALLH